MKEIIFYILVFTVNLLFTELSAADKQKIVFFRPAKAGSVMQCRLSAVTSTSTTTSFADINRHDKVNSLNRNITAAGELKILSVKNSGHASKVEFTVDFIHGTKYNSINNRNIKSEDYAQNAQKDIPNKNALVHMNKTAFKPAWKGKIIVADLNVKPICEFRIKGSDKKLSSGEIQMLSLLFRPAPEENISDYIGTDKLVGIGDTWTGKVSPFVKLFKKQGLLMSEKYIQGTVMLKSRKKYEGIDCWEIEEKLNVISQPNFTFHFSLSIFMPVDSRLGNLKMTRKAFERIEKTSTGKHFMTSGIKKITLEMKDTMTAIMLPEK
jgi:hypothetical protein